MVFHIFDQLFNQMNQKSFPTLYTSRLILRQFTLDDAVDIMRLAGDREVAMNTLNMPHPYLPGMAEDWITTLQKDYQESNSLVYAICLKDFTPLIGAIGLTLHLKIRNAELGYWIGKDYWNNGYCTEAVKAIIDYAFTDMTIHKIYANFFASNPASGRVMEKVGMKYEACLKSHLYHWGEYKDIIYYSIFNKQL